MIYFYFLFPKKQGVSAVTDEIKEISPWMGLVGSVEIIHQFANIS